MDEDLPLVVTRPPGVDAAVLVPGVEGGPDPLLERVRGLDVVVAVDQDRGAVRAGVEPLGRDDRVAARLVRCDLLEADAGQLAHDPLRRALHLACLGWIGAD